MDDNISGYTSEDPNAGTGLPPLGTAPQSGFSLGDFISGGLAIIAGAAVVVLVVAAIGVTAPLAIAAAAVVGGIAGISAYNAYHNTSDFKEGFDSLVSGFKEAASSTEKALAILPWVIIAGVGFYAYNKAKRA